MLQCDVNKENNNIHLSYCMWLWCDYKKTNAKIVRITVKEKKLCLKNPTNYTQNLGLNTYRKKERKLER